MSQFRKTHNFCLQRRTISRTIYFTSNIMSMFVYIFLNNFCNFFIGIANISRKLKCEHSNYFKKSKTTCLFFNWNPWFFSHKWKINRLRICGNRLKFLKINSFGADSRRCSCTMTIQFQTQTFECVGKSIWSIFTASTCWLWFGSAKDFGTQKCSSCNDEGVWLDNLNRQIIENLTL